METVSFKGQRGPFNDLFDIKSVVDVSGAYNGNVYSNAQYLLNKLIDDRQWSVLGHTFIVYETEQRICDKRNAVHLQLGLKCNSDVMQHMTKGIYGMRIDNVKNVKMDGFIRLERLHNLREF